MYEINEAWNAYYEELDPQKRLELLDRLPAPDGETKDFCKILYQERYVDPKHPERKVDMWLWKFAYLPGLYRKWKFIPGALKKEMQGTMEELHLNFPENLSNIEKTVLYWEYRNATRRYLSTCKGENYGKKFLSMKKANAQEKLAKACEDIWIVSQGLAHTTGLEKNMELWCTALRDELNESAH